MGGTGLAIRPVRSADAAEWLRLRRALWPDEGKGERSQAGEIARHFARGGGGGVTLVAERRDRRRLGGFLELGLRAYAEGCATSPVAYVEGLYVERDFRRRGAAEALLAAAEAWARTAGDRELASDALIKNAASLAWHGRMGFAEVERVVCFRKLLL
jgi:aminoglycoside 6'-N-acetyltransferase I